MEKMKNIMSKLDKKKMIIIGCVLLAIILIVVVIIIIPKDSSASQKKELTARMEELGKTFYEDLYYKQVGTTDDERKAFLQDFTTLGIKINLNNLARYNSEEKDAILAEFKNKKTNEDCDVEKTQVIVYPEEPFEKDSYRLEVELVCGFDEEEKDNENEKEK